MKGIKVKVAGWRVAGGALVVSFGAILAAGASIGIAQPAAVAPATAVLEMDFKNPQLLPPHWQIRLNQDGSGRFDAEGVPEPSKDSDQEAKQIEAGDVHRSIQLSPGFTDFAFAAARRRRFFAFPCDSHLKVAYQGTKTLTYSGPDGSGACEYNYSKDKEIQTLGESLMAVETTLIYGARLEKLLVHDRLGIDQEMENLITAAKEGNARELGTIREVLAKIAADDQVMDRARRKARLLLAQSN